MKPNFKSILICLLASFLLVFNSTAQEQIYYGDCQNGFGVKVAADKTTIYGNFQNGQLNGYSLVIMPDGSMYAGFLKDNVCWGKGIMLYAQGYVYMGDYEKNAQHGTGTMFAINTQIIDGTWNNNQPAQVNKIETKNQNMSCDMGDCDKGPGQSFKDVTSFSCFTTDMIIDRKSKEYQYFGPRTGEGNMTIITKDWIYVGMGKDREPMGIGAKVYMSGKKYEVGNWSKIKLGNNENTIFWELNKPCPLQVNLVAQFKLPVTESIYSIRMSNDAKRAVIKTENTGFGLYDFEKKTWKPLSGTDEIEQMAISSNGQLGAYCTKNQIKIFNLLTNKLLITYNDSVLNENFLFTPDGQNLIYSVDSTFIGVWGLRFTSENARVLNVKTGKRVAEFETSSNAGVDNSRRLCGTHYYVPYCPYTITNSTLFAYGSFHLETSNLFSGKLIEYSVDTTKVTVKLDCNLLRYAVSPSGNRVAYMTDWGTRIFRINSESKPIWHPEIYLDYFNNYINVGKGFFDEDIKTTEIDNLYFTTDENGLLAVTRNEIVFIDLRTKNPESPLYSEKGIYNFSKEGIHGLRFTADGSKLYYTTLDDTVFVYEIKLN